MVKNSDAESVVRWEAEEYVSHEKNAGWYFGLVLVCVILSLISIRFEWWTFTAVIVVSVIAIVVYSVRPPRKIQYVLSAKGLTEGEKMYHFEDYKAFGILQDDVHFAIILMPKKRFAPAVTVYFPENKGEEIVNMFGERLPMEEVKLDMIDKIVRKLRI